MNKKTPRILILDSDLSWLKSAGDVLRFKGFEPVLAKTGASALAQIEQQPVDVALIDLRVEDMPGLDVLSKIKAQTPNTECIMLSNQAPQNSTIEAINLGAYAFFQKPFDMESLLVSICHAIEGQEAKIALAESEARYQTFINAAIAMVFLKDDQFRYVMVNEVYARFFDKPMDEIIGKDDLELMEKRAALTCRSTDQQVLDTNAPVTTIEPIGNRFYETHKFPVALQHGRTGVGGYIHDVTRYIQAEEKLKQEQYLMQTLMDTVPDVIYFKDIQSRFIRSSRSQLAIFGIADPDQIIGKTDFDFFSQEHAQAAYQDEQAIIRTGRPLVNIEEIETFIDRPPEWVSTTKMALRDQNDKIVGTFGISRNITARKEAEQQLQDRASTMASLYDAGLALNSVLDSKAQFAFLSKIILDEFSADRVAFLHYLPVESCYSAEHFLGFSEDLQESIDQAHFPADETQFPVDWVRVHEQPLYKPNSIDNPAFALGDPEIHSTLWAPVKHGQNIRGILGVMSTKPQAFTRDQERLFILFSNQAAVALENASLLSETRLQIQRLKSLQKIDDTINASLDLGITSNILLEEIMSQLNVDAADILLLDPFTNTLSYLNGRGFNTPALQHTEFRIGQGLAGRAANENETIHISDLRSNNELFTNSPDLKDENFYEYYGVPLISKGSLKGLLEIFHRSPIRANETWIEFLETMAGQAAIAIDNIQMFDSIQRSNNDLTIAYDATIEGWSHASDLRHKEAQGHTQRVTDITIRLAKAAGIRTDELVHIRRGAMLHDIGKLGIPDNVLLKSGTLTAEEWEVMQKHPEYAFELISPIAFLRPALDIPYCHHEKWDGSGYPRGLKGEQIPLSARLFAVTDVWDALTSDRRKRAAWPKNQAIEYIREQAGKHFDPQAVELFMNTFLLEERSSARPTILMVDDDEGITRALALSLQDQFTVLTANSGEDALEIAQRSDPAVVLTDQRMPGMSGVELMEQLLELNPKIIGLLISGFSDIAALTTAINLPNVHGFIPKPWDLHDLRQKLGEAVIQYREGLSEFYNDR